MDSVEPSANAMSAHNLFRLGALLEDESYIDIARKTIAAFETEMEQYPASFPGLLVAGIWGALGGKRVVIVGDHIEVNKKRQDLSGQVSLMRVSSPLQSLLNELRRTTSVGRTVLVLSPGDGEGLAWLKKRNGIVGELDVSRGQRMRMLICENGACREVYRLGEVL